MSENFTTKNIHYVSAACGAGKTHIICDEIAANPNAKYIVVLPTMQLGSASFFNGFWSCSNRSCFLSSVTINIAGTIFVRFTGATIVTNEL